MMRSVRRLGVQATSAAKGVAKMSEVRELIYPGVMLEGTPIEPQVRASTDAVVDLDHVTVRFGPAGALAVDDVSIQVGSGELLVLVGHSGSGKTTLLNVAAGLVSPTSGQVRVLGVTPALARTKVAYMFARDALLPWRTAQRNVELGLEILKVPRAERRRRASEMLSKLHLADAAGKLSWQLSQGMRQRVALARTWVRNPSLLLMDEPFAALDAMTRVSVYDEFLRLWSGSRISVLLVTHDLTEALLLGDRVITLANGRIVREVRLPFERPRDPSSPGLLKLAQELSNSLRAIPETHS